jgi:hypothetical protein
VSKLLGGLAAGAGARYLGNLMGCGSRGDTGEWLTAEAGHAEASSARRGMSA